MFEISGKFRYDFCYIIEQVANYPQPKYVTRDEMTGEQILQPGDVPDDIEPLDMRVQGNYGVAIDWSDGHNAGIYSYEMIEEIARANSGER